MLQDIFSDHYQFEVKNYLYESDHVNALVVLDQTSGQKYLLNELCETTPYIQKLITEENIVALSSYTLDERGFFFSYHDKLFIGFRYFEGVGLSHYLENHLINDYLLLKMLEELIITGTSYVQSSPSTLPIVFDVSNIVITADEHVEVNFIFYSEMLALCAEEDLFTHHYLGDVIDLFASYLSPALKPELTVIRDKCRYNLYSSLADVAYAVKELRASKRDGFMVRLKKWLAALKQRLQPLVKLALLVAILFYVYRYIDSNFLSRPSSIDVIGSYAIAQNGDAQLQTTNVPKDHLMIGRETREVAIPEKTVIKAPIVDDSATSYRIKPGDTLTKICIATYGTAEYVNAIASYNLLASANLIYPGNELKLPSVSVLDAIKNTNP
ncbi:MAG: LysM peptidoglycan-binding domain-containing protein [Clostridia bacterium]|nr:LysM peptidoglycan-binding domain-containing protein [Clostridia bacterium]